MLYFLWLHKELALITYGHKSWLLFLRTENGWHMLHYQIDVIERLCVIDNCMRCQIGNNISLNTLATHLIVVAGILVDNESGALQLIVVYVALQSHSTYKIS